jgi:hypothetical protein
MATFFHNLGLAFLIAGGLGANTKMDLFHSDMQAWELLGLGVFGCMFFIGFAQIALLRHLKE